MDTQYIEHMFDLKNIQENRFLRKNNAYNIYLRVRGQF